jgi:IS30 family transposase
MPAPHITAIERGKIEALVSLGKNKSEIAKKLGRSNSAIKGELERCKPGRYNAAAAQADYDAKRTNCGRTPTLDYSPLATYVKDKLSDSWSPEQIAGRIKLDHPHDHRMRISHETIYLTIYNNPKWHTFAQDLRRGHKKRRNRSGTYGKRALIPNRVGIERRPAEVDTLETDGHWEGDTVIGANQKGAIVTLVERKNDLLRAIPVVCKKAEDVAAAIIKALGDLPKTLLKTITFDNGLEFAQHGMVSKALGTDIYFAEPYSSWQRGRNENMNGLLREYFPKKTSFENLEEQEVYSVVNALNNRPRKKLGYRTPNEATRHLRISV